MKRGAIYKKGGVTSFSLKAIFEALSQHYLPACRVLRCDGQRHPSQIQGQQTRDCTPASHRSKLQVNHPDCAKTARTASSSVSHFFCGSAPLRANRATVKNSGPPLRRGFSDRGWMETLKVNADQCKQRDTCTYIHTRDMLRCRTWTALRL